jgi:DNA-binding CsgD family transcriptional regulator
MKLAGANHRFARQPALWIRWLSLACSVPIADIAVVLELSEESITAFLTRTDGWVSADMAASAIEMHAAGISVSRIGRELGRHRHVVQEALDRGGSAMRTPTGPPRLPGIGSELRGPNASKVRRLASLSYPPARIAKILAVDVADVKSFLARTAPVRGASLAKPRSRPDHARMVRNQARAAARQRDREQARAARAAREVWGKASEPDPAPPPVTTAVVTEVRELDASAAAELPATAAPPASTPWTGPTDWRPRGEQHGSAKLTQAKADEIRRRRAGGESMYSLARQFHVAENTIRAIVTGRTWTDC